MTLREELRELVSLAREALARYARGRVCATCQGKGLVARIETQSPSHAGRPGFASVAVRPCADCHGRGWVV